MRISIAEIIKGFRETLPAFPDGRIDYSTSNSAPVVLIFVKVGDEFLILRRSQKVSNYQGQWSGSAGFLDNEGLIQEKVFEELIAEIGIPEEQLQGLIAEIKIREHYEFVDKKSGKTWIKVPVLVELRKKPTIKLDWEHDDHRWIRIGELPDFETVIDLETALQHALG
ncbi:MAG: NUDIX domain-containing protein [Candidatus Moranbacteria bacterium]|nr:NUDIX domain-containing protein [Candidatus Moranbacteria bacterium]